MTSSSTAYLPHPPLYLSEIRPVDIILLLTAGAVWEAVARTVLLAACKRKSKSLRQQEQQWESLQVQVTHLRKLGQQVFVECSKVERQLLQVEKDIERQRTARTERTKKWEKRLLRYGNIAMSLLIFVLYYGIPVIALEPLMQQDVLGAPPLKSLLFPVSYVGLGMRAARFGLPDPMNSIGALVVFWSAQVLVGQAYDAMDYVYAG
eukprot:scaffold4226_cov180-Amphora_coffeaeformis.AAC.6